MLIVSRVAANGDARLCLRRNFAGPRGDAIYAGTVPLRQAAASRAPENVDADQPNSRVTRGRSDRAGVARALKKNRHGFQHRFDPPLFRPFHNSQAIR